MVSNDIDFAIRWWVRERRLRDDQSNSKISLLSFIFKTLDSLYETTRYIPLRWGEEAYHHLGIPNSYSSIQMINTLNPQEYALLRSALSLTSDLYLLLTSLIKEGGLAELDTPIKSLYREANEFRDVRNLFSHLDSRLSDLKTHGITEEKDNINDCFYLVISGEKIYFTQYKKRFEKEIGRSAFDGIFNLTREIYGIITSHNLQSREYVPALEYYPL